MIPRSLFDADHELFRDTVRRFLQAEAEPHREQWEEDGQVSREIWQKAGEQGFLCPTVSEEFGGAGVDFRFNTIVGEEVSRLGITGLGWTLHSDIVAPYFENNASQALKEKYLPGMVTGELISAIAMTEPGAGSDLQGVKTTAVLEGNEYVINGSKTFITNGAMADIVVVVCKTDPTAGAKGISLIVVDAGTPGFSKGKKLKKVGLKAQDTSELFFENVRVPKENLIGDEGKGFIYLMSELPQERLQIAISAVAAAEGILDHTVEYVKERKAFGQAVSNFQNTQFKLAELDTRVTAARVFLDRCLELHLDKKLDIPTVAKLKLYTTEMQNEVIDECLQLHGGYGYMWEYPVARAWADARVQRIYGGTNEVMKIIISRDVLA